SGKSTGRTHARDQSRFTLPGRSEHFQLSDPATDVRQRNQQLDQRRHRRTDRAAHFSGDLLGGYAVDRIRFPWFDGPADGNRDAQPAGRRRPERATGPNPAFGTDRASDGGYSLLMSTRRRHVRKPLGEDGLTLIEVLVAAVILAAGSVA